MTNAAQGKKADARDTGEGKAAVLATPSEVSVPGKCCVDCGWFDNVEYFNDFQAAYSAASVPETTR
jgi:hypothetical protein